MKNKTVYIADNWKQFNTKSECIEYEKHIKFIEGELSKIDIPDKKKRTIKEIENIFKGIMKVFKADIKFQWVKSYWYNEFLFGRAINDCTNGYDKPYLKYYNIIYPSKYS